MIIFSLFLIYFIKYNLIIFFNDIIHKNLNIEISEITANSAKHHRMIHESTYFYTKKER